MKRTWFAIGLLIFILSGCIATMQIIQRHTKAAVDYINTAAEAMENENYTLAVSSCEKAISYWNDNQFSLNAFLRHDETGAVETGLTKLLKYAQLQNKNDFLILCAEVKQRLRHIRDAEFPGIHNIL